MGLCIHDMLSAIVALTCINMYNNVMHLT